MKGIIKQSEPEIFTKWKAQANEEWQPTYDKLQNPEKKAVRRSLLEEQGYICAYCCSEIKDDNRTTVIEHFIPQSDKELGESNQLNYKNLFASCDGTLTDDKSKKAIYCCDESKKDQFRNPDNPIITVIKPTETNENGFTCEQAFAYTMRGGIFEKEGNFKETANYSIQVLNLDNNELQKQRGEVINFLFEDIDEGQFFDFREDEVQILKQRYASKNDGKFIPFCQIVLYFLNQYYP